MAHKPILYGRELSADELETIRTHVESFDTIEQATPELRKLIAEQWPHLLAKLAPKKRG